MVGTATEIVSYDYDKHPIFNVLRNWFIKEIDDYNDDVIRMIISYKTFKNPSAINIERHLKLASREIEMLNRNLRWEYDFDIKYQPLHIARQIHNEDVDRKYHKDNHNMAIKYLGKKNMNIYESLVYNKYYSLDCFYKDQHRSDNYSYDERPIKNSIVFNDRSAEAIGGRKSMRADDTIWYEFSHKILENTFYKKLLIKYDGSNSSYRWNEERTLKNAFQIDKCFHERRKHLKLELYCYSRAKIEDWYIKELDDMKLLKFYNLKNITKVEDRHIVDILTYSIMVYFINNFDILKHEEHKENVISKYDDEYKPLERFIIDFKEYSSTNIKDADLDKMSFDVDLRNGAKQQYHRYTITNLMVLNKLRNKIMKDLLVNVWNNLNNIFSRKHRYWDKLRERMTLYMKEYRLKLLKDSMELVLPPYSEYETDKYCFNMGKTINERGAHMETVAMNGSYYSMNYNKRHRYSGRFWNTYEWFIQTKQHLTSEINKKFMSIEYRNDGERRLLIRQSIIGENMFANNQEKILNDISNFTFLHTYNRGYDNSIEHYYTRTRVKCPKINKLGIFIFDSYDYKRTDDYRIVGQDFAKTINTKYINYLLDEYSIEYPKKLSLKEKVKLLYTDCLYQDIAKWKKQFKKTINRIPKIKTKLIKVRNCDKRYTNDTVVIHQSISSA